MMKFNLDKTLIASGFIGPAVFFFTVYFLFQFFYHGYDIGSQTISELGALQSPVKLLTNLFGFSLFGIFIMLFSLGLFRSKEINLGCKTGAFFMLATGILMYLTGIFYNSTARGFSSIDKLHIIVSNYQFPVFAIGLVIFAFGIAFNRKLRWLTAVILVGGLITLWFANIFFFTHELANRGLWQRAAIGLPYILMMIVAIALYRAQFSKIFNR